MLEPFNLEGKDLFEKIGHLGRRVSDETVKMAADVVRVLGNKGIHPGEIDLTERADSAKSLFLVVNMLVQNLIAGPAAIKALHGSLPKGALESIDTRDKKLSVESDD